MRIQHLESRTKNDNWPFVLDFLKFVGEGIAFGGVPVAELSHHHTNHRLHSCKSVFFRVNLCLMKNSFSAFSVASLADRRTASTGDFLGIHLTANELVRIIDNKMDIEYTIQETLTFTIHSSLLRTGLRIAIYDFFFSSAQSAKPRLLIIFRCLFEFIRGYG